MKTAAKPLLAIAALAPLLCPSAARAASARLGPGSFIRIDGTSTLHAWSSESRDFQVDLELGAPGQSLLEAAQAAAPARLSVRVPVSSFKSEHKGLDKNLRKALKAGKNPDIVFALTSYGLQGSTVSARGGLTVAGKTSPETLQAALAQDGASVIVDGRQPLKMTDFGVKPPTAMLGTIKSGDDIVVTYHVRLDPAGGR